MNRRRYLGAASLGLLGALAGCADALGNERPDVGSVGDGSTPTSDVELPIPDDQLTAAAGTDAIAAIVDPAFGPDWRDEEASLPDEATVIGVERDGAARAYPLPILNWHEVVNDDFGGPLLVTYCPLCGSGVTGVRRVDGEPTVFGVSGQLWKSDLVMYDRATDSLWSQRRAQAIQGPRTGDRIELVAAAFTTWATWREEHPDTGVLLPPPTSGTIGEGDSVRDYELDPYDGYGDSDGVGIANRDFADDRLHVKTLVIGVTHNGVARAYPKPRVLADGVVTDAVNGLPVVVTTDADDRLVAYERTVDGETLAFEGADDRHLSAGGSRWRAVTGRAVDGPYAGTTLSRANDVSPEFWFAWASFHPETAIYGE